MTGLQQTGFLDGRASGSGLAGRLNWVSQSERPPGARYVVLFTALLLISSTVPVLAETPSVSADIPALDTEANRLPTSEQTAEGVAEAEQRAGEEEEQRETPIAEREREESRLAYADLSASETAQLLRSEFGEQLALIDQDPARALSEAELQRPLGPTGALVEVEGNPILVDGTTPVRARTREHYRLLSHRWLLTVIKGCVYLERSVIV